MIVRLLQKPLKIYLGLFHSFEGGKILFGLDLALISDKIQGKLLQGHKKICPRGAAIDTRKLKEGDLFFALPGSKTNGHVYLEEAQEMGAAAAVISRLPGTDHGGLKLPLILVEDSEKALQQLAQTQRKLFFGPVVAVTGSTGKTTTKDMLAAILQEKGPVLSTTGNYNNQLGLPLTILSLQTDHWALVIEMGMRDLGEIDFLATIARPTHGIITNIGHSHRGLLGSQERIAQAKAELISHIPITGGLALNIKDKKILKPWLSNIRCPVQWFDPEAHNVLDSLAPAAIARQLGLSGQDIRRGLAQKTILKQGTD